MDEKYFEATFKEVMRLVKANISLRLKVKELQDELDTVYG